jgi:hypothetical protein
MDPESNRQTASSWPFQQGDFAEIIIFHRAILVATTGTKIVNVDHSQPFGPICNIVKERPNLRSQRGPEAFHHGQIYWGAAASGSFFAHGMNETTLNWARL